MKNLLILCTGNSCRSQIAEGYFRYLGGEYLTVFSAGVETHGVNPRAIQVMAEDGIDISSHASNHVDEFLNIPMDYVITVCDSARERCPVFPSTAKTFHQNFPDPAKATGSEEEITREFTLVRDMIKEYSRDFIEKHIL